MVRSSLALLAFLVFLALLAFLEFLENLVLKCCFCNIFALSLPKLLFNPINCHKIVEHQQMAH